MTPNIMLLANQLWVSYDRVRQVDTKFYDYIKVKVSQKAMQQIEYDGKKYILYDERLRSHREKLGDKQTLLSEAMQEQSLLESQQKQIFRLDILSNIKPKLSIYSECIKEGLTEKEAQQMMLLVGWLEAVPNFTSKVSWEELLILMNEEWQSGSIYGKALETSLALKNKIKVFQEKGWQSLIDGRKNNQNNAKFQEWHKAIIYKLYTEATTKLLAPTIYSAFCKIAKEILLEMPLKVLPKKNFRGQIIDNDSRGMSAKSLYTKVEYVNTQTGEVIQVGDLVFNKNLHEYSYEIVDFETVRRFITDKDFVVNADAYRHGTKYHNDKHRPFSRLKLPQYALSLVTMDDYHNNFYLLKAKPNGTLVASTERLITYTVWDTATDIPLGSAHGLSYNKELVFEALYNAMLFIKQQTGKFIAPCEVEMERMFTKGSKKIAANGVVSRKESDFEKELQRLFYFTTLRQNPQSKLTESRQRIAQDEFFGQLQWYVGNNIQSTKQSGKQNPDVRKQDDPSQCVTTEQVIAKWNEYRDFKCNEKHPKDRKKSRLQYFLENLQAKCPVLDDLAMVQIFAQHLGCVTTVADRRFELQVKDRIYRLPVTLFNQEDIRKKVPADGLYKVKYLPHDTNKIYLYNPTTDVFICEVYEKQTAQRAKVEQTEEDKLRIAEGNAEMARLKRQIEQQKATYESLVADFDKQIQEHSPVRKWTTVSPQSEMTFTASTEQTSTGLYDDEEPSYDYID